jgi:hypothetical protein
VQERYEDDISLFYEDVPPELASEALKRSRRQSEARMGSLKGTQTFDSTQAASSYPGSGHPARRAFEHARHRSPKQPEQASRARASSGRDLEG